MGIFRWNDSYLTQIDTVDEQHQRLVVMINNLDEAIQSGSDDILLADLLGQLVDYTKYHFSNEERVMADPRFDQEHHIEHKAQHVAFVDRIVAAQKAHADGTAELSGELMEYLVAWLIDHIVVIDKRMAEIYGQCQDLDLFVPGKTDLPQCKPSEVVASNLISALRESQDRFRDLADSVPAMIWMSGSDKKVQYFNRHLQKFTGLNLTDLRAAWLKCVHPDDRADVRAKLSQVFRDQVGCELEYRLRHADKSYRWISETIMPRYLHEAEFLGLIGCGFDVSNEKKAKAVLERANETLEKEVAKRTGQLRKMLHELNNKNTELECANEDLRIAQNSLVQSEKMKSIGQLAAGVAHEINTPSQYIADNTRFLQDACGDIGLLIDKIDGLAANKDEPIKNDTIRQALKDADIEYLRKEIPQAIEASLNGVERITKMVRALKEYSRPSNAKEDVALNEAIDSTVTVATNEWSNVAEITMDLDPELPPVFCQRAEFNQVILNMLINSAHAIATVVGDGSQGKGTITLSTRKVDDFAEICIADTGCGMSQDVLAQAFDPFFTTKDVGEGMGQGLSAAYAIVVEKHGGTITLQSEVGKGTRLAIRLPIAPAASMGASEAA